MTLFPGSRLAGDGNLVALGGAGRAEGSSPCTKAYLGHGGAGACVAPPSPHVLPSRAAACPHTSASAATSTVGSAGSPRREQADTQTDRQTGTCKIPRLYCKIVFSWQLQLSRGRLAVPQTLPSPAQGLPGGTEDSQGEKHPNVGTSRRGVAVTGGAALAGWGARGEEGIPAAPRWSGWVGSPVPWCCHLPQRAVGFPGHGSCAGSSPRRPRMPGPARQAPSR